MGYLRCERRPHFHQFVTRRRSGKPELSFAVEVQFTDEMEASVSAGWALWWSDGGHGQTERIGRTTRGAEVALCQGLSLIYTCGPAEL